MATALILYWLKANAVLLVFAAAYFGWLRRLTFFRLNRLYLLAALLLAAVYPALPVPALLPAPPPVVVAAAPEAAPAAALAVAAPATTGPGWTNWLLAGYALGAAVLLLRLLGQLGALAVLHARSRPGRVLGLPVRVLPTPANPFSFGRSIYLHPAQHPDAAELAAVLRHEQAHVRQGHTLDTLLAELTTVLAWCNPAAWLLRRAILDNLEYLADAAVLRADLVDRRRYQYTLLRLSQGVATPALVSHFAFSTLKNRVLMMNAPISSRRQLFRYLLAGPVLFGAALGVAGARAQAPAVVVAAAPAPVAQAPITPAAVAPAVVAAAPVAPLAAPALAGPGRPEPRKRASRSVAPARTSSAAVGQAPPVYFIDGQRAANGPGNITPADIASMKVLKGEKAQALSGGQAVGGVILITTKAHEHDPAVVEFNSRYGGVAAAPAPKPAPAAAPPAAPVPYLAPNALVYITQHYPGGRLLEVSDTKAADGSLQHRALIVVGRRPAYVIFDDKGEFVAEQLVGPSAVPTPAK